MTTRMNDINRDEGKIGPSRIRRTSQVVVIGNIGGNHVPDVFNTSNDVWCTFNYQGRQKVYRIKDSQRSGGQRYGGGRLHRKFDRDGYRGRYNNNINNWIVNGGYSHGGRGNYQGSYGGRDNNEYFNNSNKYDNHNASQRLTTGGQENKNATQPD